VLQRVQAMHARKDELISALTASSPCPTTVFETTLLKWAQGELVEHEVITLARHYSTKRDAEVRLPLILKTNYAIIYNVF
jgi:hypothetical protein